MKNRHKYHQLTKRLRFSILLSSISLVFGLAAPAVFQPKITGYSVLASAESTQNSPIVLDESDQQALSTVDSQNLDVSKMNDDQKQAFTEVIAQSVNNNINLPTEADKQDATKELVGVFDSTSENHNNLAVATENLASDIDENHASPLDPIDGETVLAAQHGAISVAMLGAAIDGVIFLVSLSSGFGSLVTFIRAKGLSFVRNKLKVAVTKKMYDLGLKKFEGFVSKVMDAVLGGSIGMAIAKLIDANDKIRNNKYIELW